MKSFVISGITLAVSALVLCNCHTSKKTAKSTTAPAVTFSGNVKSLVETKCAPCHIPEKGGNKKALNNYDNLKSSIGDVITRIHLNPTDRGFMPARNPKLSDEEIAVFTQWRDAGTPE